jgi:hypothetical protein
MARGLPCTIVMNSRNASPPHEQIQALLRTLRGERHLRRPLLAEVVDRLAAARLLAAARAARDLFDTIDHNAPDFEGQVDRIERLVQEGRDDAAA